MKKRVYLIAYIICLVLLFSNIPYSLFIKQELFVFILSLISEIIAVIVLFYMIKKEKLIHDCDLKLKYNHLLFLPFILICFSNFFVALYQNSNINNVDNYQDIIYSLILCVLNIIIEEFLFRYIVCYEFEKYNSKLKSIIYSSLIFASIHLLNISSLASIPIVLIQVIYTFGMGLILSLIYIKSNHNIIYPIILHLLFNIFNDIIVVNLFDFNWDISFYVINILIGIIMFIYSIFIYKRGENNAS